MLCSAKPCEKQHRGIGHQLHPFVYAHYRSVTSLLYSELWSSAVHSHAQFAIRRTILIINIFILCTEVVIEHMFVGFIQNVVVYIKNQIKVDYPHHAII